MYFLTFVNLPRTRGKKWQTRKTSGMLLKEESRGAFNIACLLRVRHQSKNASRTMSSPGISSRLSNRTSHATKREAVNNGVKKLDQIRI